MRLKAGSPATARRPACRSSTRAASKPSCSRKWTAKRWRQDWRRASRPRRHGCQRRLRDGSPAGRDLGCCRARAGTLLDALSDAPKIVLYEVPSMHETRARLIAFDLQEMTDKPIAILSGGRERWKAEGRPIEPTPADAVTQDDRIDFLYFGYTTATSATTRRRATISRGKNSCRRRSRRTATRPINIVTS